MVSFIYSDSGHQPATDRRILADGSGGENSDLCDGSFVERRGYRHVRRSHGDVSLHSLAMPPEMTNRDLKLTIPGNE